ncbi:hypothetical protein KTO58_27625 [Chitinophaga pendula]|uniref:hypothetical protein n=1 Tax=Chitinophaga TaxID=79328 RepID=UPI000BAFB843|nr:MULTISPECIES: hypothetical protein [Chitinophaga]ASZ09673.1 hypothetical protein CK934_01135 [Chitinophaga sp. MD30]UCJ07387.1 hypothetical protein KTO58_27625 [Chitinophaga pendula]
MMNNNNRQEVFLTDEESAFLQKLGMKNRADVVAAIIGGTLLCVGAGFIIDIGFPQDTGALWIGILLLLLGCFCIRWAFRLKGAGNTFATVRSKNTKTIISGWVIRIELTKKDTIRYIFEQGEPVEVKVLLAQTLSGGSPQLSRRMFEADSLQFRHVSLHVVPAPAPDTWLLLQVDYEQFPTTTIILPMTPEDKKAVMKEPILFLKIMAGILFVATFLLFCIGGFRVQFLLPVFGVLTLLLVPVSGILYWWMWKRGAAARDKVVISGVVTEKFIALVRVGKNTSSRHPWYRIGAAAIEAYDKNMAAPGDRMEAEFTWLKEAKHGNMIRIRKL